MPLTKDFKKSYVKYINGEYNEDELMFAKNFPKTYRDLSTPEKLDLKGYI